jgi:hypothetical protein
MGHEGPVCVKSEGMGKERFLFVSPSSLLVETKHVLDVRGGWVSGYMLEQDRVAGVYGGGQQCL